MEGYIYLIQSKKIKDRLYLGSTQNPAKRILEHNQEKNKSTKNYGPWECVLIIKINSIIEARKIEFYIKKQKEKLSIKNIIKILNYYFSK